MVFDKDFFDKVASDALLKYSWDGNACAKMIVLSENATYMVKNKETGENMGGSSCKPSGLSHSFGS